MANVKYEFGNCTVNIHGQIPKREALEKALIKYVQAIKKEPNANRLTQKNHKDYNTTQKGM